MISGSSRRGANKHGAFFIVLDRDGRIVLINCRASEILGYPVDEAMGEPWIERFIPAEEQERCHAHFSGLMQGDVRGGEYVKTPVLTVGGGERLIKWHTTVFRGEDGAVCGTFSSGEDSTERQHAEAALARANMKLNLLSGITRHDILNQIIVARAYVDFAMEDIEDPAVRDYLRRARSAVEEIHRQIEFTRDYQDMGVKQPVWQRLEDLIRESAAELGIPAAVLVRVDLGDLEIYADPMVKKVFYNLIDNAVRHGGA